MIIKQKAIKKTRKIIAIVVWSLVFFLLVFLFKVMSGNNTYEIDKNGEEINGIFKKYQNQIYAAVPSDGYMPVSGADVQTFRALLDDTYNDAHIGLDKNNVYAGNLIIPKLNPTTTKALGNNYYSDGKSTYYCDRNTIINPDLNDWKKIWQTMKHEMFDRERPQIYLYPTVELPESKTPYYPILDLFLATDGQKVYYKGLFMPDANPLTLRQLDNLQDDDIRKSYVYYADNQNVYYENLKLPIKYNDKIYSFCIDNLYQELYLYNPLNGTIFIENIAFPKENAPYKVISRHGSHVNQVLFSSKNGIYFYDTKEKEIKKIGENPFLESNFQEIAPLIFSDGTQILYLESSEHWGRPSGRSRSGGGLISRSTHLYRLEDVKGNWESLGTTYKGSVWKNNNQFYYFDELGRGQLLHHTIYKISDWKTANKLLKKKTYPDEMRNLIRDEKLTKVKRTEILEAKTKYR